MKMMCIHIRFADHLFCRNGFWYSLSRRFSFFAPSTPTREHSLTKSPITCCISKVLLKGLKTTNPPLTLSIFACRKNNVLSHKNFVSIFDETIISWACDFSNQEIMSKMMLTAYSQVFITHSGFSVQN